MLGTALALLLSAVVREPFSIGSATITSSRIFMWWLVVGFCLAAIGFLMQGIADVKQDIARGRSRHKEVLLQILMSTIAAGIALYLALLAAKSEIGMM